MVIKIKTKGDEDYGETDTKVTARRKRRKQERCLYCPPNKGENEGRKAKHGSKKKKLKKNNRITIRTMKVTEEETPKVIKRNQKQREDAIKSNAAKEREIRIQKLIKKYQNKDGVVKEGSGGLKRLDRKTQASVDKDMKGKSTRTHGPIGLSDKSNSLVDRYLNKKHEGNKRLDQMYTDPQTRQERKIAHLKRRNVKTKGKL